MADKLKSTFDSPAVNAAYAKLWEDELAASVAYAANMPCMRHYGCDGSCPPPPPPTRRQRLRWWLKGLWYGFWGAMHAVMPGQCDHDC